MAAPCKTVHVSMPLASKMQHLDTYQLYWLFLYYPFLMLVFGLLCRSAWAHKNLGNAAANSDQDKSDLNGSDNQLPVATRELLSSPPAEVAELHASTFFGIILMAFYHLQAALAVRYARQNAHTKTLTVIMLSFSTFLVAKELVELMLQIMRAQVEKERGDLNRDKDDKEQSENEDVELIEKEDDQQREAETNEIVKHDVANTVAGTGIHRRDDGSGMLKWLRGGLGLMLGTMLVPWARTFMA